MPRMLRRLTGPALAAALVAAGLAGPAQRRSGHPPGPRPATRAPAGAQADGRPTVSRADRATAALAEAQALFDRRATGTAAGATGRDTTLVLRDLVRLRSALPAAERAEADAILARPTDGAGDPSGPRLHHRRGDPRLWRPRVRPLRHVDRRQGAAADDNHNGTPDFVELARTTMEHVHRTYVKAGYRAPKSDGTLGGDARTDVYLEDIGDAASTATAPPTTRRPRTTSGPTACSTTGSSTASSRPTPRPRTSRSRPPTSTSTPCSSATTSTRTTGSWRPPPPGPRTSCTTAVNDNLQYLRTGQLGPPYYPLDYFEWLGSVRQLDLLPLPHREVAVVGRRHADHRPGDLAAGGRQSRCRQQVLDRSDQVRCWRPRRTSLADEFGIFTARNRFARTFYDEGAAQNYPRLHASSRRSSCPERGFTNRATITFTHLGSVAIAGQTDQRHRHPATLKVTVNMTGPVAHDPRVVVDRVTSTGKHVLTFGQARTDPGAGNPDRPLRELQDQDRRRHPGQRGDVLPMRPRLPVRLRRHPAG